MCKSRLRRLGIVLAAGCCAAFVIGTLGADGAWAGDCSANNFVFNLGTTNSCNTNTVLAAMAIHGLEVSDSVAGSIALLGRSTSTTGTNSYGVYGSTSSSGSNAVGVVGILGNSSPGSGSSSTTSAGVRGISDSGTGFGPGVYGLHFPGNGTAPGVLGETNSANFGAIGVKGVVVPTSPGNSSVGMLGVNHGTADNGTGVEGSHDGSGWGGYFHVAGNGRGVYATAGNGGLGVYGVTGAGSALGYGVRGASASTAVDAAGVYGSISSAAANAAGVRGTNSGNCCGMGVAGFHTGSGIGVYGEALNGFAVSGFSPNNWSGYFQGSVNVVGTLYKSSGAFRIDNPIDAAHSYLQHSFVESPQMTNIYKGHATTDAKGFASVQLPKWFGALNKDFEYQLTVVGKAHWDARAAVWQEIAHNRFTIRTDQPNVKVSWQVTGVRHDAYANANRIQVVVPKEGKAEERYVHPELYGQPLSKSVVVLPGMTPGTRPKAPRPSKQQ